MILAYLWQFLFHIAQLEPHVWRCGQQRRPVVKNQRFTAEYTPVAAIRSPVVAQGCSARFGSDEITENVEKPFREFAET
jgi:hypothetical protein